MKMPNSDPQKSRRLSQSKVSNRTINASGAKNPKRTHTGSMSKNVPIPEQTPPNFAFSGLRYRRRGIRGVCSLGFGSPSLLSSSIASGEPIWSMIERINGIETTVWLS